MAKSPERLLPHHLGGEEDPEEGQSRQEMLQSAPDFEEQLREYVQSEGREPSEEINYSVRYIEDFQDWVREAEAIRRTIKASKEPERRDQLRGLLQERKEQIDWYLQFGPSFEKSYREYLRERRKYYDFDQTNKEITQLNDVMASSSFEEKDLETEVDDRLLARVEHALGESATRAQGDRTFNVEKELDALRYIWPEDSAEYKAEEARIRGLKDKKVREVVPETKGDLKQKAAQLEKHLQGLWEEPMVRYFANRKEFEKILTQFHKGEDVVETQSVVHYLNKLHEWEGQHQRTTIGGVLTGPPGVGKTTLIRHYLEEKERNYVYIDLSEDVTRYLLYGSKDIQFKSATEHHKALAQELTSLDEPGFRKFVSENSETLQNVFHLRKDEATVAYIALLQEQLGENKVDDKEVLQLQSKIKGLAGELYRKELATEFAHLVKRNGWRDGVIVAALRRGESVIMDEFNKNKNWSLIYSLMTAKPGEDWYFADNDEHIQVPADWKMYFTANVGRKHGGFAVAEALASRAGGKAMEVGYPPRKEEMAVALSTLANPDGVPLRSIDDISKMYVLVNEVFPNIRETTKDQPQAVSISYRTLRDIGEKLVRYRDPETGKPVYQPTRKTFDEAVYEVLIATQETLYEDKSVPKEIVDQATSVGLLLDERLKEEVTRWIGKEAYEERKAAFEKHAESYEDIKKKIQGIKSDVLADGGTPGRRQF